MTDKATEKAGEAEVKRVDVKLLVDGHMHRGLEIPKGGTIDVTEKQAKRLVDNKRAVRV